MAADLNEQVEPLACIQIILIAILRQPKATHEFHDEIGPARFRGVSVQHPAMFDDPSAPAPAARIESRDDGLGVHAQLDDLERHAPAHQPPVPPCALRRTRLRRFVAAICTVQPACRYSSTTAGPSRCLLRRAAGISPAARPRRNVPWQKRFSFVVCANISSTTSAQLRIASARLVEEAATLLHVSGAHGRVEHRIFHLLGGAHPVINVTRVAQRKFPPVKITPARSQRTNRALAQAHCRSTVRSPMPMVSATSRLVSRQNFSTTTRACSGSSFPTPAMLH